MPYPIPDDLNEIEGWRWYLVPLPDNDQMIRVAWGMWTELTNYWMWGEEGPVPELSNQAAQIWSDAIYEAFRVMDMGFPDNLLLAIDEIEPLLEAIRDKESCCEGGFLGEVLNDPGGVVGIDDENIPGDDVVWDVGDPPGDAEDWEEATLERCAQAETFAANLYRWIGLSEALQEVGEVVSVILFVGAVAAFLPALGLTAIAGALSIGSIYGLMQLLQTALSAGPDFSAARAELQDPDVIDEIVCAVITASTAAGAETAIDSALETHAPNAYPMLAALPLRFMMGALFNDGGTAGGFGGPCRDCGLDFTFFHGVDDDDMVDSNDGWSELNGAETQVAPGGSCSGQAAAWAIDTVGENMRVNVTQSADYVSHTLPGSYEAWPVRIEVDVCRLDGPAQLRITDSGGDVTYPLSTGTVEVTPAQHINPNIYLEVQSGAGTAARRIHGARVWWKVVAL